MDSLTFDTTDARFRSQVLQAPQPVLIEFTADWCPPCKMLAPIMHDIARGFAGRLRVGLLDADINPVTVQQYGVMSLPTVILFVNGVPVERIVGFAPRHKIESKLLPHLAITP